MVHEEAKNQVIEEYEDNEATGVEAEDAAGPSLDQPYDATKIRVDPKTFSLRQIIDMIKDGDLDLAPDFQRKKVWKMREKSRLIESILLRIPLPAFYFSADNDGLLRVVDGLQRLSTVDDFVKGAFALTDLEYLRDGVLGRKFSELDTTWTRRIHQTQIFANVIDPQTPTKVKFDIFKRLNTGGSPLNAQEIRHCMSGQRCRDFLKACTGGYYKAESNEWLLFADYQAAKGVHTKAVYEKSLAAAEAFGQATNWAMWDHVRMADREVILRFAAFRLISTNLEEYGPGTAMDDFLTEATEKIDDGLSDRDLGNLAVDLERAMWNAREIFGDHAFRKWPLGDERMNPINRALFESWSVALADYTLDAVKPHKKKIVQAARREMAENGAYVDAISAGTGDRLKVRLRFETARNILAEHIR